jgi:hypothetical protein
VVDFPSGFPDDACSLKAHVPRGTKSGHYFSCGAHKPQRLEVRQIRLPTPVHCFFSQTSLKSSHPLSLLTPVASCHSHPQLLSVILGDWSRASCAVFPKIQLRSTVPSAITVQVTSLAFYHRPSRSLTSIQLNLPQFVSDHCPFGIFRCRFNQARHVQRCRRPEPPSWDAACS